MDKNGSKVVGGASTTTDEELQCKKVPLDPKQHLTSSFEPTVSDSNIGNNDTSGAASADGGGATNQSTMTLEEWARQVKVNYLNSHETAEITIEQLERIKVVHDKILDACSLSFNYNTLILVASVIAGLGLAANSVATIIASMLVSPIMGPVAGMAYGTTIRDWRMVKRSVVNEVGSLVFCILMGAIIGAITGTTSLAHYWPTPEMTARGSLQNFLVGLPIAFFSGLGVAVSLLDDHFNSLVGVAISSSLLPPAVNAGILWVAYGFYLHDKLGTSEDINYQQGDFLKGGILSLSLTLANIVLIYFSSMIMFRLKEILPIKKKVFWVDLGVARKIFQDKAFLRHENDDGGTAGKMPVMDRSIAQTSRTEAVYRQASVTFRPGDHPILEDPE